MGFFGSEFVDVRAELGASGSSGEVVFPYDRILQWQRRFPGGLTLYFGPGRYLLRRWRTEYQPWTGDYDFSAYCTLWFDEGARLVFDQARVLTRGDIVAPKTQIFQQEDSLDGALSQPGIVRQAGMVLIESELDAVYPEWWGAAKALSETNHIAINAAIQTATSLRNPAITSRVVSPVGTTTIQRHFPQPRPPIPVVFSDVYEVRQPVQAGRPFNLVDTEALPVDGSVSSMDFGNEGSITAILRGARTGTRARTSGLRYVGEADASSPSTAVLHLWNSFAASVENLKIDGNLRSPIGILAEPTKKRPQMHSVLIRRCTVTGCLRTQIQIGPIASPPSSIGTVRVSIDDRVGLSGTQHGGRPNIRVPVLAAGDGPANLDMPGLQILECEIDCAEVPDGAPQSTGLQLRAANGVAVRIADCRFTGRARTFIDAAAIMALVERCDFHNQYFRRKNVVEIIKNSQVPADTDAGPLGFEQPEGQDVYLSSEPFRRADGMSEPATSPPRIVPSYPAQVTAPAAQGAVALYACHSRSFALFGTVRPGPLDAKRADRSNFVLGCIHRPAEPSPLAASVSWGRKAYSGYRAAFGSPGYNPDPCFTCVGSHLASGVEVYYGAPQCALVALDMGASHVPRFSAARHGVRAQTFIFGFFSLLALLAIGGVGCHTSHNAPFDAGSGSRLDAPGSLDRVGDDVTTDITVDAPNPFDHGSPDDELDVDTKLEDVPADLAADRPPLVVPGTVPIDSYGPASQQRHRCPAGTDGEEGIPPPRLVAPMSPLRMTSQRPTLRWELAGGSTGARVEICRDPCCMSLIASFDVVGTTARPANPLPPGVVFWRARGMIGTRVGRQTSFTWEFGVPHRDSAIDTFKGPIHDFNGDTYDDVVVSYDGFFRVYWGSRVGISETQYTDYESIPGDRPHAEVGDIDGDGFADMITSSRASTEAHLYAVNCIFRGTPGGLVAASPRHLAFSIGVSLGDVNGDGFADISLPLWEAWDDPGPRQVVILYGGASGVAVGGHSRLVEPSIAQRGSRNFGSSSAILDTNGDGYAEVAVGDPTNDSNAGAVYVYPGRPSGAVGEAAQVIRPDVALPRSAAFGSPVEALGDIDDDGLGDVFIGALGEYLVYYHGSSTQYLDRQGLIALGGADPRYTYPGAATDLDADGEMDAYWGCVTCLHDIGDGAMERTGGRLLVASHFRTSRRIVRVLPPPPPLPRGVDGRQQAGDDFGSGAVAVDIDGDGFDDLATADPEDASFPLAPRGRISVYYGGRDFSARQHHVFVLNHARRGRYGAALLR